MTDLLMKRTATYARAGTLRLTLGRQWADGPCVFYLGHNPSTAGHEIDDPTSIAWVHFARAQGFGSYIAGNLYPFRSSSPAECRHWAAWKNNGPDWYARDDLMHNLEVVARAAKAADRVVACYGEIAKDGQWIDHVLEEIQTGEEPWPDIYCLGVTASGAPKHPMARGRHRIPRDQRFMLWRSAAADQINPSGVTAVRDSTDTGGGG